MDHAQSDSDTFLAFGDSVVRGSVAVVADYAAALTWVFSLFAYVSAGAFRSPVALVLLVPAVLVSLAALAVRRRTKLPPNHRSGPAHAL